MRISKKNTGIYTDHAPIVIQRLDPETGQTILVYTKTEMDDNWLFVKNMSVSINAEILRTSNRVEIHIPHRGVCISASADAIGKWDVIKEFYGEIKFYYPIEQWKIESGDTQWVKNVYSDRKMNKLRQKQASK